MLLTANTVCYVKLTLCYFHSLGYRVAKQWLIFTNSVSGCLARDVLVFCGGILYTNNNSGNNNNNSDSKCQAMRVRLTRIQLNAPRAIKATGKDHQLETLQLSVTDCEILCNYLKYSMNLNLISILWSVVNPDRKAMHICTYSYVRHSVRQHLIPICSHSRSVQSIQTNKKAKDKQNAKILKAC